MIVINDIYRTPHSDPVEPTTQDVIDSLPEDADALFTYVGEFGKLEVLVDPAEHEATVEAALTDLGYDVTVTP